MSDIKKISADYVFPVSSPPIKEGVVEMDLNGKILEVRERGAGEENLEIFSGVICPGFINTHCHLELSYLKGVIPEHTGMAGFIKNLLGARAAFSLEQRREAIQAAEKEMIKNGIVAVGDISNDDTTFEQKGKGNLKYHTFFELFDLDPSKAIEVFNKGVQLQEKFKMHNPGQTSSIVPHAPYTVSEELFKLIRSTAEANQSIISCHNQESRDENLLFQNGSGSLYEFFTRIGLDLGHIPQTGVTSLQSIVKNFSTANKTLLVHNTFTNDSDIARAMEYFNSSPANGNKLFPTNKLYWCFCPQANLYIENCLPVYQQFIDAKAMCTIGTDSLASNHSLSILTELKTISKAAPQISLQTLLTWACLNGAQLLGFEKQLGSIEKGKQPGLNLISKMDLTVEVKLTSQSEVRSLI